VKFGQYPPVLIWSVLENPVPVTVNDVVTLSQLSGHAIQSCPRLVTDVIVGVARVTATFADPHTDVNPLTELHAVTTAVPTPEGVKVAVSPEPETVPPVADQVTAVL
jgi:hypothetical protein